MVDVDSPNSARDFAQRERPLEGLCVLELGSLIAGPFATRRPNCDDHLAGSRTLTIQAPVPWGKIGSVR